MSRTWQNGLFSCFSDVTDTLIGCFAPCVTFGETDYRLLHEADTQTSGMSLLNSPCALFYLLSCPTCGIYPCLKLADQRSDIRTRLGIKGSSGEDLVAAYCCTCCVAIQNKHEVQDMQELKGVYAAGGAEKTAPVQPGAQQSQGMVYSQESQQPQQAYSDTQNGNQQQMSHPAQRENHEGPRS